MLPFNSYFKSTLDSFPPTEDFGGFCRAGGAMESWPGAGLRSGRKKKGLSFLIISNPSFLLLLLHVNSSFRVRQRRD